MLRYCVTSNHCMSAMLAAGWGRVSDTGADGGSKLGGGGVAGICCLEKISQVKNQWQIIATADKPQHLFCSIDEEKSVKLREFPRKFLVCVMR